MNQFITAIKNSSRAFAKDEDGAQVIEYALIIAVVSIVLVLALQGLDDGFAGFKTRVENCLAGTGCSAGTPSP